MCARSDGTGGGSSPTADREITSTRVFDAPRELVFKMWTERHHMEQWWGPNGFTTTTQQIDVKPGGVWRFVMHGPDGTDYPNKISFTEIVENERLAYQHGGEGEPVSFTVTILFEAIASNKTKLHMHMLFPSKADRDRTEEKYGAIEGQKQHLARLEERLARQIAGETDLVLSRIFSAPRDVVFKAWTDPKHLAQWWGPHGMTTPVCEIDLRPGGKFRTVMRDPDGNDHPTRGVYREVDPPQRLVFDIAPLDDKRKAILEMTVTLTFEDFGRRTRLTARVAHQSPADRQLHEAMGFFDGWGQTWERLETHLATM